MWPSIGELPYVLEVGLRRRWTRRELVDAGPKCELEIRRMAELIFRASSFSDFQLSLFSDDGLLEKVALGLRTAIREGRSRDARFRKLLPSISRRGEFSLSDERGRLVVGGGAKGELPAGFDKKPALKRPLFFGILRGCSEGAGGGELAPEVDTRGIFRGMGDAPRGSDGSGSSELTSSAESSF